MYSKFIKLVVIRSILVCCGFAGRVLNGRFPQLCRTRERSTSQRQPGNEIRFQVDTGSECDLLPLKMYKSITGDNTVERLEKCNKSIVSYTGERKQIAGKISLPVWHKDRRKTLTFNVVNGDYQPVLSLNTSIMLGIVTLADCDVLSLAISPTSNTILEEYKDVFEGLGELPGEYKITTDESVKPKVHPPRRVPVAVRPRIKEKLDELVQRNVITPVTEPTEWVSSMLAVIKPNKIRICLDPRDLNEAIKRERQTNADLILPLIPMLFASSRFHKSL